jgi:hypothetical protein
MGTVTTSLQREARSIFDDLGYTVSAESGELRAERKWRTVRVTPVEDRTDLPTAGEYRCFVTWTEDVGDLEATLEAAQPAYEWAIIGVERDGDHAVVNGPGS